MAHSVQSAGETVASGSAAVPSPDAPLAVRRKPMHGLSFCTETTTSRGRLLDWNHFDIPPIEHLANGGLVGARAFLELVFRLGVEPGLNATGRRNIVASVIEDLCRQLAVWEQSPHEQGRREAARTFLYALAAAVADSIRFGLAREVALHYVRMEKDNQAFLKGHEAQQKARFVERMREGKARRRAREAAACAGREVQQ